MAIKTLPFDAADYIETPDDATAFMEAAFESGDPAEILLALRTVSRSKGMSAVANKAEMSRQTLYKALGEDGNPSLDTFLKVINALGLKLSAKAA